MINVLEKGKESDESFDASSFTSDHTSDQWWKMGQSTNKKVGNFFHSEAFYLINISLGFCSRDNEKDSSWNYFSFKGHSDNLRGSKDLKIQGKFRTTDEI